MLAVSIFIWVSERKMQFTELCLLVLAVGVLVMYEMRLQKCIEDIQKHEREITGLHMQLEKTKDSRLKKCIEDSKKHEIDIMQIRMQLESVKNSLKDMADKIKRDSKSSLWSSLSSVFYNIVDMLTGTTNLLN